MKYRKYILILFLVIFIGLNRVEAEDLRCYYIGNDFKAVLDVTKNGKKNKVTINNAAGKIDAANKDIANWKKDGKLHYMGDNEVTVISSYNGGQCPKYLILTLEKPVWDGYLFGTDNENEINIKVMGQNVSIVYGTYLHDDGTPITEDEYYGGEIVLPNLPSSSNCQTQYDICIKILSPDRCLSDYNKCIEEQCGDIFGNKNDEESLAYLINKVLMYVRIIVPILIIVLGMIDLAKAVIASKEDEMRKAQKTFVKRLIIGVVVFFVPVLVNLLMSFADMIWENYSSCGIDNIIK